MYLFHNYIVYHEMLVKDIIYRYLSRGTKSLFGSLLLIEIIN